MPAYYVSQGYDAPAQYIWSVLTDFPSWPEWFPRMSSLRVIDDAPAPGAELYATGETPDEWTRWKISEFNEPALLVCDYVDSHVPISHGVEAAYLQFELFDEPEGCTLEVEIGADGQGVFGDFFVGFTLGAGVRRMLPRLMDAFSEHVVRRAASQP